MSTLPRAVPAPDSQTERPLLPADLEEFTTEQATPAPSVGSCGLSLIAIFLNH